VDLFASRHPQVDTKRRESTRSARTSRRFDQ
jgi:hypothetical protein